MATGRWQVGYAAWLVVAAGGLTPALATAAGPTGPAATAPASAAEEDFEQLYGPQFRKVVATPDKRDDLELAKRVLSDALRTPDDAAFQAYASGKAYDLAARAPNGSDTTLAALELLGKADPARKLDADEKRLTILGARFARLGTAAKKEAAREVLSDYLTTGDTYLAADRVGEAIDLYQRAAGPAAVVGPLGVAGQQAKLSVARRLEQVRGQVKAGDRAAAGQLADLLLIELARPADAAKVAASASPPDASLARAATLAAKELSSVAEPELLELAAWYRGRSASAGTAAKPLVLARAKAYYDRFAAVHVRADGDRLKALYESEQIGRELAAANGAGTGPTDAGPAAGRRVDLLANLALADAALGGTWAAAADGVTCESGLGVKLRLPYRPTGGYDFRVDFTRRDGEQVLFQSLVFGGRHFAWVFAANGATTCGFAGVGGKEYRDNPTTVARPGWFRNGQRYSVVVRVRQDGLTALVDGAVVSRFPTDYSDLVPDPRNDVGVGQVGIGAVNSKVTFHVAEVTEVGPPGAAAGPPVFLGRTRSSAAVPPAPATRALPEPSAGPLPQGTTAPARQVTRSPSG